MYNPVGVEKQSSPLPGVRRQTGDSGLWGVTPSALGEITFGVGDNQRWHYGSVRTVGVAHPAVPVSLRTVWSNVFTVAVR